MLSRRRFIQLIGKGVILTSLTGISYAGKSKSNGQKPNFIFILTDDQGWSATSVQMHPLYPESKSDYFETPNLERLAKQGMRFTDGYAPAPICTPTRRSIQFGQTPARQRGTQFKSDFNPVGKLSIPLMLKSIDPKYVCAHFGKWGAKMGAPSLEAVGYDESDGLTTNKTGGREFSQAEKWDKCEITDDPKLIFSITDRSIDFMQRQAKADRPFYLQISHYAVHVDMRGRAETVAKYQAKGKSDAMAYYAAMTEDLDTGVGKILEKVEELGIGENTYVFC